MTEQNTGQIVADEVAAIAADPDAEVGPDTTITRPGGKRAKILSVRLHAEEWERLEAAAVTAGVPPSTLARGFILRELEAHEPSPAELLKRIERLERRLGEAS